MLFVQPFKRRSQVKASLKCSLLKEERDGERLRCWGRWFQIGGGGQWIDLGGNKGKPFLLQLSVSHVNFGMKTSASTASQRDDVMERFHSSLTQVSMKDTPKQVCPPFPSLLFLWGTPCLRHLRSHQRVQIRLLTKLISLTC